MDYTKKNVHYYSGLSQKKDKYRQKGKCHRYVWGTEFIQFLAAPAILQKDDFEEYDEIILFFKSSYNDFKEYDKFVLSENYPGADHLILQIVLVQK